MPYKDCECVRVLRDLSGQDLYGETQVSIKAGSHATVINVFSDGEYEVEFQDPSSPYGWGVLHARETDLAPYVENAV